MPVYLDRNPSTQNLDVGIEGSVARLVHIGLVNNMPDGALQATEMQFLTLLGLASYDIEVRVSLYALPDVPRGDAGREHISRHYSGIDSLLDSHLDGLIVTGAAPQAPDLTDEPYWGSLTKVVEWSEHNTCSTVWSCLAAHAAILRADGVPRQRLGEKRFGVFECTRASNHELIAGIPTSFQVPHSRWNDVREADLTACGYHVLTRSQNSVDSFIKKRASLFVFFQGHPEYQADTLLLEYRRDVGRFLKGEMDTYPSMPQGYFNEDTAARCAALRERSLLNPRDGWQTDFPGALAGKEIPDTWQSTAVQIYANWLKYICAEIGRQAGEMPGSRRLPPEGWTSCSQGREPKHT